MHFLIIVEVHNLRYVFSNFAISAGSRGRAIIFSTLVPLLIQILMLLFFSLSFFVEDLAASSRQKLR